MSRAYDNAADARFPSGRRNLIINGGMEVAQRGTSVTGQTANGYYTLDRWRQVASGATFDSSQQTLTLGQSDIPAQFRYFQRFNVTSGGDNCGPQTRIEDVNRFDGTLVTLSFYAKGTNPSGGHITVVLDQIFGSGGSTTVSLSEDVTLTSSWQRFTVTKTLGSLSGKTVGTSSYLGVKFNQPSDDNTTNAWSIDFTGVQLEYGNVATPFEHRSYGEELALCQRYYFKHTVSQANDPFCVGMMESPRTSCFGDVKFAVPMRADPTALETTGTATDYEIRVAGASITCNVVPTFIRASIHSSLVKFAISSTELTDTGQMRAATTSGYLAWSAEL